MPGLIVTAVEEEEEVIEISDNSAVLQESCGGLKNVEDHLGLQEKEPVSLEESQLDICVPEDDSNHLQIKENKLKVKKRIKVIEIKWKSVRRLRRKTKFFSFCEEYGGHVKVEVVRFDTSQQVWKGLM